MHRFNASKKQIIMVASRNEKQAEAATGTWEHTHTKDNDSLC